MGLSQVSSWIYEPHRDNPVFGVFFNPTNSTTRLPTMPFYVASKVLFSNRIQCTNDTPRMCMLRADDTVNTMPISIAYLSIKDVTIVQRSKRTLYVNLY